MTRCTIAAMYKFAPLPDPAALREPLRAQCERAEVVGSLLLAPEGINGTISGPDHGVEAVLARLRGVPGFEALEVKRSFADTAPFHHLRVRIKREIVSMGEPGIDPTRRVGTYVEPEAWNDVLTDRDRIVIDTRNEYEVRVGTFRGAVDPGLSTFRDFPGWVRDHVASLRGRRVAMFCTGGIRCEKASALLLEEGVQDVVHLRGGVLRYFERVPHEVSLWQGECFVFDQRVCVTHDLSPGSFSMCFGCKMPLAPRELESPLYENGVCCHRCASSIDDETKGRRRERMRQIAFANARGISHFASSLGDD